MPSSLCGPSFWWAGLSHVLTHLENPHRAQVRAEGQMGEPGWSCWTWLSLGHCRQTLGALLTSSDGLSSRALSPFFAWLVGMRVERQEDGCECCVHEQTCLLNIQSETQVTTSSKAKKSKHTEKTETENKQFLELQTQTELTTMSVQLNKLLLSYLCL